MTAFDDAMVDIIEGLGDYVDTVTLYPVRAAMVGAFLSSGSEGSSVTCVVERRPLQTDSGINNFELTLSIDSVTADAHSLADRQSSFFWRDRLYDVVRVDPDDPAAVVCYTKAYG